MMILKDNRLMAGALVDHWTITKYLSNRIISKSSDNRIFAKSSDNYIISTSGPTLESLLSSSISSSSDSVLPSHSSTLSDYTSSLLNTMCFPLVVELHVIHLTVEFSAVPLELDSSSSSSPTQSAFSTPQSIWWVDFWCDLS